jgi:hypothetical protein
MGAMALHLFWLISFTQDMGFDRQRKICLVLLGGFVFVLGINLMIKRKSS